MRKKYNIVIVLMVLCLSCNSEDAPDCFQLAGTIIQREIELPSFSKIRIEQNASLLIKQGPVQQVILETGENLYPDVAVYVEGDVLVVRDNNSCNYVRDFGLTKAIVTTPNISEIRNGSSFEVRGEGVLAFDDLELESNTTGGFADIRKSGDFIMTVQAKRFRINANGLSGFYINGTADLASITFQDESPRFEGADFMVDTLQIFQRSANTMIVNPIQIIEGKILGTGDVISVNRPPEVNVEELFTGRLLFQ